MNARPRRYSRLPGSAAACCLGLALAGAVLFTGCRQQPRARDPRPVVSDLQTSRFSMAGVDRVSETQLPYHDDRILLTDTFETLYIFDGRTGEPLIGRQVLLAMRQADVVILGETHLDPVAHRLQERFVRDVLAIGRGALSLEMMNRMDQELLDELYQRRRFSRLDAEAPTFAPAEDVLEDSTLATWPRWRRFYLPAVGAALAMGRPVVAANAPREYVSAARTHGYGQLRALDDRQQALFDLPEDLDSFPQYRQRFERLMRGHGGVEAPPHQPSPAPQRRQTVRERASAHLVQAQDSPQNQEQEQPRTPFQPVEPPAEGPDVRMPPDRPARQPQRDSTSLQAFYEAQLVWDATMARSIAEAHRRHGGPVVHLAGSFHSDYNGALTQMLRRQGLQVVTMSFVQVEAERLRPEDVGRAEIVIYTGPERPLPPDTRPPAPDRAFGQTPPVAGEGPAAPPVEEAPEQPAPDEPTLRPIPIDPE